MYKSTYAVIINLDRDLDRLAHMRAELTKADIDFERFAAIDGRHLPENLKAYFAPASNPDQALLSAGEIGCYASHLAVCQKMVAGQLPSPLLVFEDDIELVADFSHILAQALSAAPKDWDMIRLSNDSKKSVLTIAELNGGRKLVHYSKVPTSTGAYLMSLSGAQKFLQACARALPVDQDLMRPWAWDLNMYGINPAPVRRDIFDVSTIDQMTPTHKRSDSLRIAHIRTARVFETLDRHLHGTRKFGLKRWVRAEMINISTSLMPKLKRQAYLARACEDLRADTVSGTIG
jgi:glycosyl transferase, family 25